MLKFILADSKIKFATHKVAWVETSKKLDFESKKMVETQKSKSQDCYSMEDKDRLVQRLSNMAITPTVEQYGTPPDELLARCESKVFSEYSVAEAFVNGEDLPKTPLEILQETVDALIISSLEG